MSIVVVNLIQSPNQNQVVTTIEITCTNIISIVVDLFVTSDVEMHPAGLDHCGNKYTYFFSGYNSTDV